MTTSDEIGNYLDTRSYTYSVINLITLSIYLLGLHTHLKNISNDITFTSKYTDTALLAAITGTEAFDVVQLKLGFLVNGDLCRYICYEPAGFKFFMKMFCACTL